MLRGYGTCIGKGVTGTRIKILQTTDIPEAFLNEVPKGEIGEIAVQGPQVTPGYFEMAEETRKAKIILSDELWHRMGDLGWLDQDENLWFLGRKTHRVETLLGSFYPMQVESIFNQHPKIKRTSLVKIIDGDNVVPGLVIERTDRKTSMSDAFLKEMLVLKDTEEFTKAIRHFLLHPGFPVDVRHNIKIDRIKLTHWAQEKIRRQHEPGN